MAPRIAQSLAGSSQLCWRTQWRSRSSFLPSILAQSRQLKPEWDQRSLVGCCGLLIPHWPPSLPACASSLFWWQGGCLFTLGHARESSTEAQGFACFLLSGCCFWWGSPTLLPGKITSWSRPWISSPWTWSKWNFISAKDWAVIWQRAHLICNLTLPAWFRRKSSSKLDLVSLERGK